MNPDLTPEDVFEEFSMEEELSHVVLKAYVDRYPDLAIELTDLYHELALVDARVAAEEISSETKATQSNATQETLLTAFSNEGIPILAKKIGLPRDFLAGFRDRHVLIFSTPEPVLSGLSQAIGVRLHDLVRFLCGNTTGGTALAFKANQKPISNEQIEYGTFIEELTLSSDQKAALERLSQTDGTN